MNRYKVTWGNFRHDSGEVIIQAKSAADAIVIFRTNYTERQWPRPNLVHIEAIPDDPTR